MRRGLAVAGVAALGPILSAGQTQLVRDRATLAKANLSDESIPCLEAFFASLPELLERPVALTAPGANNGAEMPGQSELLRTFFDAAVNSRRACLRRHGRYFGVRGDADDAMVVNSLQAGAGSHLHFSVCAPRQCTEAQVAGTLAGLAAQFILGLPKPLRLLGASGGPPIVEELGDWSDLHVDFVIAGFAKCGTTAMAEYLDRHPSLQLADVAAGTPYYEDESFISSDLLPSRHLAATFRQRHHGRSAVKASRVERGRLSVPPSLAEQRLCPQHVLGFRHLD